jgi:beta-lactamase class A
MGDYRSIITAAFGLIFIGLSWHPSSWADGFDDAPELRESYDPTLQAALEQRIDAMGLRDAVRRQDLCVAVVDISDPAEPRVAEVNGDYMMYAASLPKIGILLGAFVEIERGHIKLDNATTGALTRMIRNSSNEDATLMLNRVGKYRVNQILRSNRNRLYDPLVNGGLWVGKEYAKGTAFERDPLHNLSHGATALQTVRFYYMLETGQLTNPRLTRIMKEMLSKPGINHKFVKGLADLSGVKIYRKSGTWHEFHSDSAIVETPDGHRYILAALAHNRDGGQWLTHIASSVHGLIAPTKLASARRHH